MAIGQRWTLVTFYDTDLIRTVNIEWVILALVLLGLYISAYAALVLGVLVLRPRYRAPWLWPDVTRSREYADLLPPLVLLAAAFSLSTLTQDNLELVSSGVAGAVPDLAASVLRAWRPAARTRGPMAARDRPGATGSAARPGLAAR